MDFDKHCKFGNKMEMTEFGAAFLDEFCHGYPPEDHIPYCVQRMTNSQVILNKCKMASLLYLERHLQEPTITMCRETWDPCYPCIYSIVSMHICSYNANSRYFFISYRNLEQFSLICTLKGIFRNLLTYMSKIGQVARRLDQFG